MADPGPDVYKMGFIKRRTDLKNIQLNVLTNRFGQGFWTKTAPEKGKRQQEVFSSYLSASVRTETWSLTSSIWFAALFVEILGSVLPAQRGEQRG